MLVSEAIQRVLSLYSKGIPSKDSRLSERHVYSCLLTARSTILQQKANKNQYISQWNYQTLPCVKLIEAPLHECPCAPKGVLMLRSEIKLPKIISNIETSLVQLVVSMDSSIVFDKKEYSMFTYTKGRKYTSNKPFYFVRNEYLYLGAIRKLEAVPVVALFHDPIEVQKYPRACDECDNCNCKSNMDFEFPVDGDLIRPILSLANEELIILFKQMSEDKNNDGTDSSNTTGSMVHQPQEDQQQ